MGQLILKGNEFPIIGNNIVCLPFPTKGHAGLSECAMSSQVSVTCICHSCCLEWSSPTTRGHLLVKVWSSQDPFQKWPHSLWSHKKLCVLYDSTSIFLIFTIYAILIWLLWEPELCFFPLCVLLGLTLCLHIQSSVNKCWMIICNCYILRSSEKKQSASY